VIAAAKAQHLLKNQPNHAGRIDKKVTATLQHEVGLNTVNDAPVNDQEGIQ